MLFFRGVLTSVARYLASDPRVQAKATKIIENEVKPRAEAAWRETKPKLDAARNELQGIAKETPPLEHPIRFTAKVRDRMVKRFKER